MSYVKVHHFVFASSLSMLACFGCGPSGETLFKKANEAAKANDFEAATKLMFKAAEKEYPEAMLAAGEMYIDGQYVEPNAELGFSLIRKAAEANNSDAMYSLSGYYKIGKGVKVDAEKSRYWFNRALQATNLAAMCDFAETAYWTANGEFIKAIGTKEPPYYTQAEKNDMTKAIAILKQLTEEPSLTNKLDQAKLVSLWDKLASIYEKGLATPQSFEKAIPYFERKAALGDSDAMYKIGSIYCKGQLGEKDYDKGVAWLKKSREHKDSYKTSQLLGLAYLDNEWFESDLDKALSYFEEAVRLFDDEKKDSSSHDHPIKESLYWLGRILVFEDEQYRDINKGIKYLERASETYHLEANYLLAIAYVDGIGVKRSLDKAEFLLYSAQKSKDKEIAEEAAKLYEEVHKARYPSLYRNK